MRIRGGQIHDLRRARVCARRAPPELSVACGRGRGVGRTGIVSSMLESTLAFLCSSEREHAVDVQHHLEQGPRALLMTCAAECKAKKMHSLVTLPLVRIREQACKGSRGACALGVRASMQQSHSWQKACVQKKHAAAAVEVTFTESAHGRRSRRCVGMKGPALRLRSFRRAAGAARGRGQRSPRRETSCMGGENTDRARGVLVWIGRG